MRGCKTSGPAAAIGFALIIYAASGHAAPALQLDGRLFTAAGGPVADGEYPLTLKLFDAAKDGKELGSTTLAKVPVVAGAFAVAWGMDAGKLAETGAWIQVQVGQDPPLARRPLAAAPYALRSTWAASAASADTSKSADTATVADSAKTAGHADTAASAKTAETALKAGQADKAATSAQADFATTAETAKTAAVAESAKAAEISKDLQCTGCVSVAELKFDMDVDLQDFSLKTTGTVTAKAFVGDGSKLTGLKTLFGKCAAGSLVTGIGEDGKPECVALIDPKTGKVDGSKLPFEQRDLIAPGDRVSKGQGYFSLAGLGIAGTKALHVRYGVAFGPQSLLVGQLRVGAAAVPWYDDPAERIPLERFDRVAAGPGGIDPAAWQLVWKIGNCGGAPNVAVFKSNLAGGAAHELYLRSQVSVTLQVPVNDRALHFKYRAAKRARTDGKAVPSIAVAGRTIDLGSIGGSMGNYGNATSIHSGTVTVRPLGNGAYRVYHNGRAVGDSTQPAGITFSANPGFGTCTGCGAHYCTPIIGELWLDDFFVSRAAYDGSELDCDDGSPCTDDLYGGSKVADCRHLPVSGACNDGDECTTSDICKSGKCVGSKKDCDDKKPYTADSCNSKSGCDNVPCVATTYSFASGTAGWSLGSGWSHDASGKRLKASPGAGSLNSSFFPALTNHIHARMKCIGKDTGLVFTPGGKHACKYDGEEYTATIDLTEGAGGPGSKVVQIKPYGQGVVYAYAIMLLKECGS